MFWYVLCVILGAIVGAVIAFRIFLRSKSSGQLRVNDTDLDGPYLFLQLQASPYELMKKNFVTLEVKIDKTNSQK